jgi:hypothetical protein
MGTPTLPDSKSSSGGELPIFQDVPKTGLVLWLLLAGFLSPPCMLACLAHFIGGIPHLTLWIILLELPIPLVLLSLPRRYSIDQKHLTISSYLYRKRIPIEEIVSVEPIDPRQALLHPGSLFCSNPARALKLVRKQGRILVISPTDPAPFLALGNGRHNTEGGGS